jgi:hypothetical protein
VESLAVIFAIVITATGDVAIGKVADNWPAGTLTPPGSETNPLSVESAIRSPPVRAGAVSVTCPTLGLPPISVVGVRVRLDNAGVGGTPGFTVKIVLFVMPRSVTLIVTFVDWETFVVLIVKSTRRIPEFT